MDLPIGGRAQRARLTGRNRSASVCGPDVVALVGVARTSSSRGKIRSEVALIFDFP